MSDKTPRLPKKEVTELLYKKIRDLYALNYTMDDIVDMLNVSKTTVFFAIRGRNKKTAKSKS